jgi:predicted TIM-barrel fold metal-dependent hydrolase
MGIGMYEEAIEPDLPICDPHHHLWDMPTIPKLNVFSHLKDGVYMLPQLLDDLGQGHRVVRTVYVECGSFYRADAAPEMASIGEIEFANGVAAMGASGRYGKARPCQGIVSHAPLSMGEKVDAVLAGHRAAGGDRLKGVRITTPYDPAGVLRGFGPTLEGKLYSDPGFRAGFSRLSHHGLRFDAWGFHHQIPEVTNLARDFPNQPIVLDHIGSPIGVGSYAFKRAAVFAAWKASMTDLATCANVFVKVGGLGMYMTGLAAGDRATVSSAALADIWRPYVEICINLFGPARCMFESNFAIDSACAYGIMWNAFKRITQGCSVEEKALLYHDTASAFYGLTPDKQVAPGLPRIS